MSKYDDLFATTAPDDSPFVDRGVLDPPEIHAREDQERELATPNPELEHGGPEDDEQPCPIDDEMLDPQRSERRPEIDGRRQAGGPHWRIVAHTGDREPRGQECPLATQRSPRGCSVGAGVLTARRGRGCEPAPM